MIQLLFAITLRYAAGDCAQLLNLETGETDIEHVMRVEKITRTKYFYRWYLPNKKWAHDLNSGIGEFQTFELNTKAVQCPTEGDSK